MRSVFDVRRANLRKLMEQWGGPTSLAAKLGHANGSYIAQLAGPNPSREVSEKVAREIERKLGLDLGWMDRQHKTQPGQPDTNLLIEIVAVVQDLLHAQNVKLSKEKFTEVVNLVYEQAADHNANPQAYARRLINLLK
jgi:hypothetical protein